MKRRTVIKQSVLGLGAAAMSNAIVGATSDRGVNTYKRKANIKQSVCRWCYGEIALDELCAAVVPMGIQSVELTTPDQWPILQQYGLTCAVGTHDKVSLTDGFNDPALHVDLQSTYQRLIDSAAAASVPSIIVFSGNRKGINDQAGLDHCARGLEPLVRHAEEVGVQIIMELFNSKIDHPDYQCDSMSWAMRLVDTVGSPAFKLLYDIYHMQIMEGDIIRTIKDYHSYIGHYHTAGVPGRHEIDDSQELYYPAIMRAIVDTGYEGYVGQEFIPTDPDPLSALRRAVSICDV